MPKKLIKLEDLKKLPPLQRIKLLKKLEEQRKKELEEAEKLIKESIDEIKKKRETPIDEETRKLAVPGAAVAPAAEEVKEEPSLEARIARERAKEEGTGLPVYGRSIEEIKENLYAIGTNDVYRRITGLVNRAREGRLSAEEERRVDFYRQRIAEFAVIEHYIANPETKRFLLAAEEALVKIKQYELRRKEKRMEDKRGY